MIRSLGAAGTAAAALTLLLTSLAIAAPQQQPPYTFACDNGETYLVNIGSLHNNGSAGWLVGGNHVAVARRIVGTFEGEVVFDLVRGLNGHDDLIECHGDVGDGWELTVWVFLTPQG